MAFTHGHLAPRAAPSLLLVPPRRQCPAEHISDFLVQPGPDLWEIDGDLRPAHSHEAHWPSSAW